MKLLPFIFLATVAVTGMPNASADIQKVVVEANSCEDIKLHSVSGSECSEKDFTKGKCSDVDECICVAPDQKVHWRFLTQQDKKFRLIFRDQQGKEIRGPFRADCLSENADDDTTCRVKSRHVLSRSAYDFDVKINGCTQTQTQRVVIKWWKE